MPAVPATRPIHTIKYPPRAVDPQADPVAATNSPKRRGVSKRVGLVFAGGPAVVVFENRLAVVDRSN